MLNMCCWFTDVLLTDVGLQKRSNFYNLLAVITYQDTISC